MLRSKDMKSAQNFNINVVVYEMEKYAPTVIAFLQSCISTQTAVKATRKQSSLVNKDHIVAVCSSFCLEE